MKKHPETMDGEMYLTNCYVRNGYDDYDDIRWKTKRKGINAYDSDGMIASDGTPVFIQIEEYEKRMGRIENVTR